MHCSVGVTGVGATNRKENVHVANLNDDRTDAMNLNNDRTNMTTTTRHDSETIGKGCQRRGGAKGQT